MTLFLYVALFLLVCFLLRDRLADKMGEALTDGVSTVVWLAVLLFVYFICFHDR
jgi:hypothetical protein